MVAGRAVAPGCTWWELTEAVADLAQRPAAVALTRHGEHQVVHVEVLAPADRDCDTPLVQLLGELLAALRRTDAVSVTMAADDSIIRGALQAAGFVPVPGPAPGRYVVLL
jgi:hypothetical protein